MGNRTLSVFIPEDWDDNDISKTNTDEINFSDHNGYRDPNESTGISLDDLATIVNRSIEEQGADMLVYAYIEKDMEGNRQQLILKSNTGEKVGITGWPDTDYMPMPATITSKEVEDFKDLAGTDEEPSTLTFKIGKDATTSTTVTIKDNELVVTFGDSKEGSKTINVSDYNDMAEALTDAINDIEGISARYSADKKRIIFVAERIGAIPEDPLNIDEAAEALHYPALLIKAEGKAMDLLDFPTDEDGNLTDVDRDEEGNVISGTIMGRSTNRLKDQSHIDIFDYLGMETATKSREFYFDPDDPDNDETLTIEKGTQLHWRISSGGRSADIKLNYGDYTIDQIAERLKNAGTGWLEVTVEPGGTDVSDDWGTGTNDGEEATKRLVIRGFNGEQVIFLDMNEYRYADNLGVSTALRTDAYDDKHTEDTDDDYIGTGMKCVNFPSAPCVDDNIGIPMRVQMNCGMYYDVNIKRADVINKKTGFVDRALVMQEIVNQVNEQDGNEIMGFVQHVDSTGKNIEGSCAIYFNSGEAFTVVDMPFDDPVWNDYSGGLAAQMGIHGGITSNLRQTSVKMNDYATFKEAYDNTDAAGKYPEGFEPNPNEIKFREGTIRFSNLAHSVEIDIGADDTVKDVMDRLRTQAGDWLYVNYYDEHMGNEYDSSSRNNGDY